MHFRKSVTKILQVNGPFCLMVNLISEEMLFSTLPLLKLLFLLLIFKFFFPVVLVAEVDGSKGWLPLNCLQPEELMRRGNGSLDIFWKKDSQRVAERGNVYKVRLQESLGGGNYTCHSSDGSLLNHTVVLIQEDETMRRKILVKTGRSTVAIHSSPPC